MHLPYEMFSEPGTHGSDGLHCRPGSLTGLQLGPVLWKLGSNVSPDALREGGRPQQGVARQDQGSEPTHPRGQAATPNSNRAVVLEIEYKARSQASGTSVEASKRGVSHQDEGTWHSVIWA